MASKKELEKRIEALEAENKVMIAGILKISGDLEYCRSVSDQVLARQIEVEKREKPVDSTAFFN